MKGIKFFRSHPAIIINSNVANVKKWELKLPTQFTWYYVMFLGFVYPKNGSVKKYILLQKNDKNYKTFPTREFFFSFLSSFCSISLENYEYKRSPESQESVEPEPKYELNSLELSCWVSRFQRKLKNPRRKFSTDRYTREHDRDAYRDRATMISPQKWPGHLSRSPHSMAPFRSRDPFDRIAIAVDWCETMNSAVRTKLQQSRLTLYA